MQLISKYGASFDKTLLAVLSQLEENVGGVLVQTSADRTVNDHIKIYKRLERDGKLHGKRWFHAIPWGSYHLPKWHSTDILATDFIIIAQGVHLAGTVIEEHLSRILHNSGVKLYGMGIGADYAHLDIRIDRDRCALWYY